jgi:hypothetical protein
LTGTSAPAIVEADPAGWSSGWSDRPPFWKPMQSQSVNRGIARMLCQHSRLPPYSLRFSSA